VTIDRVQPLKLEAPDTGGDEADEFPTALNVREDHIECAGVVLDEASARDESVRVWRDGGNLKFKDVANSDGLTLSNLLAGGGITESQHKTLRHLVHFIDDGPAEGFASGAYKETTSTGAFPTSEVWWESSDKLKKIVSLDTTWTGILPTQEVWKVYDVDGSTVLVTITDSITYSGVFETSRTRVVA